MHLLDAPAVVDKIASQIIQQFGMGGMRAHASEVAWRGDDAVSEMIMPDAIHHHARRQGIGWIGEPSGQRAAAAGGVDARGRSNFSVAGIENRKEPGLHFVAFCETAASAQNMSGRCSGIQICHELALRKRRGLDGFERG